MAGASLTTGSNNIDIGNAGVAGEAGTIRVGTNGTHIRTYMAGISESTVDGGVSVLIDPSGHLGTATSSARYKEDIRPMEKASEVLYSLQPVAFRYRKDAGGSGLTHFGFIAEEVENIDPTLVARDEQGEPYTVRYDAVNAMLLNEFLKEHRRVEKQEATMLTSRQSQDTIGAAGRATENYHCTHCPTATGERSRRAKKTCPRLAVTR